METVRETDWETEGVVALFQISLEKYNLVFKTFIGNGNSKSYIAVRSVQPYIPNVFIATSHTTKRMGSRLGEVVKVNFISVLNFDKTIKENSGGELIFFI